MSTLRFLNITLTLGLVLCTAARAIETGPCAADIAQNADDLGSREKFAALKQRDPTRHAEVIRANPEYQVWADDSAFQSLGRNAKPMEIARALGLPEADALTRQTLFARRENWRAMNPGKRHPGEPGAPRLTDVDIHAEEPHLMPPADKGVHRPIEARRDDRVFKGTLVHEPKLECVNVYDEGQARVAKLDYDVQDEGRVLKVKMVYVSKDLRGLSVARDLYVEVLSAHPTVTSIKGDLDFTNKSKFWEAYRGNPDYYAAIRATNAYKQRAALGFTKIAPPPEGWEPDLRSPSSVPFVSTRP